MRIRRSIGFPISFLFLLVTILLVNRNEPSDEEILCSHYRHLKSLTYEGVVLDKYLDENNHGLPTIRIQEGERTRQIVLVYDISGFFEEVQAGDSVSKENGYSATIIRMGAPHVRYELNYGLDCP